MNGTPISSNFDLAAPKSIDSRTGKFSAGAWIPYVDVAEANSLIPSTRRHRGLTVLIGSPTVYVEYWYGAGITDNDLVVKVAGGNTLVVGAGEDYYTFAVGSAPTTDRTIDATFFNGTVFQFDGLIGKKIELFAGSQRLVPETDGYQFNSTTGTIETANTQSNVNLYVIAVNPDLQLTAPGGVSLPHTTALLRGDNAGSAVAVVSGTDIKTINGTSLLGSGDISISGGGGGAGTNVYYLSTVLGTTGTADLSEGSQTFGTDYSTEVQNLLNTMPAHSLVIVDGRYCVKGIKIPNDTWIHFLQGCGFILPNNANTFLLGGRSIQSATIADYNIRIDGPGILNCNGWDITYTTPRQSKTTSAGDYVDGLCFWGLGDSTFKDFTIINARNYAMLICRFRNIVIDGLTVINGGPDDLGNPDVGQINCDGIDICGEGDNLLIQNCTVHAQDDHFVIAPQGDLATHPTATASETGPITNVRMFNNVLAGGRDGIRIASDRIENFLCDGLTGWCKCYWLVSVPLGASGTDYANNIAFRNIDVAVQTVSSAYYDNYNPIQCLARIAGTYTNLKFENISGSFGGTKPDAHMFNIESGSAINGLTIDGLTTELLASDTHGMNVIAVTGASVTNLATNRIRLKRTSGYTHFINNNGVLNGIVSGVDISLVNFLNGYYQVSGASLTEARFSGVYFTKTSTNLGLGSSFFNNSQSSQVGTFILSNYFGSLPETEGSIFTKLGDAFAPFSYDQTSKKVNRIDVGTGTATTSPLIEVKTSSGSAGQLFKAATTYGAGYKILHAEDLGFYNATAGNISILNDYGSGKIIMAAGGSTAAHFVIDINGNAAVGAGASGAHKLLVDGNVGLANTSVPGTPVGGGVLYVESGALKYKGSSGTVTILGPA